MARPQTTRLREVATPPPRDAQIIDATFKVVRGERSWLARMGRWVLAFAAAGVMGFLTPPMWVLLQELGAMMSGD